MYIRFGETMEGFNIDRRKFIEFDSTFVTGSHEGQ